MLKTIYIQSASHTHTQRAERYNSARLAFVSLESAVARGHHAALVNKAARRTITKCEPENTFPKGVHSLRGRERVRANLQCWCGERVELDLWLIGSQSWTMVYKRRWWSVPQEARVVVARKKSLDEEEKKSVYTNTPTRWMRMRMLLYISGLCGQRHRKYRYTRYTIVYILHKHTRLRLLSVCMVLDCVFRPSGGSFHGLYGDLCVRTAHSNAQCTCMAMCVLD